MNKIFLRENKSVCLVILGLLLSFVLGGVGHKYGFHRIFIEPVRVCILAATNAKNKTSSGEAGQVKKLSSGGVEKVAAIVPVAPEIINPKLPSVLLLGDSIAMGYRLPVEGFLRGRFNVYGTPKKILSLEKGLMGPSSIEKLLGNKKWDVIHFNEGLHYLKFVIDEDGNMPLHASADGKFPGQRLVSPEEYQKKMVQIVSTLKRTGAKLVFATTTPVPSTARGRLAADPEVYNNIAMKVMRDSGIDVNDLYSFISPIIEETQFKNDVHFNELGCWLLGSKVAESISKAQGGERGPF